MSALLSAFISRQSFNKIRLGYRDKSKNEYKFKRAVSSISQVF